MLANPSCNLSLMGGGLQGGGLPPPLLKNIQ